ncbi:MAG TPA: TIGR03118 family protein [Solirubrobacteraceae bacterium]|nr:TIGR03118 family protein [Solirubrobacteraceae bacterium]
MRGPASRRRAIWVALTALIAAGAVAVPIATSLGASPNEYTQTNLISDIPGVARITDPNLVNPWGQATIGASPLWVADNGSNVSTLYTGGVNGSIPAIRSLVVTIDGGAPTGTVGNTTGSTTDFLVHTSTGTAPANFIFASENGDITAWSNTVSGTEAQIENGVPRAVYKGLALATVGTSNYLYATDFRHGRIAVFDGDFNLVRFPSGAFARKAFVDPNLPDGFAPFGIQLINGQLYVSYAKQDAHKHDDVAGPGNGFVDVFSTSGVLENRLISGGDLNSPWGLVLAPSSFGGFAGDLLVGNFGDGKIHAYDPVHGTEIGTLTNTDGNPIAIDGLWGLRFGNGTFGDPGTLVFTAGIAAESHGLLGEITPAN